jgi:hypothetical protein
MYVTHHCFQPLHWLPILDIQGLLSPASQTRLSSPMDLTVANSAPGHYSRNWAYSPCADHHKLLLAKSCFFCNKFVNILNTQVLSNSARRTRLLFDSWSQTTISGNVVWSSEGTARASTAHTIHNEQWDPNRQVQVPEVTSMQVCECIGKEWKFPTPDILAWGLFTSKSSRAVIGHFFACAKGSRIG